MKTDEVEIEALLEQIGAELRQHPHQPVYDETEPQTRLFSKEFLVLVNNISQKWQLLAHQMVID